MSGKKFKSPEEMFKALDVLSCEEVVRVFAKHGFDKSLLELWNEHYGAVFACTAAEGILSEVSEKEGLYIITESLYDGDDDTVTYAFSTGLHYVNRERYYLARSGEQSYAEDTIDMKEFR